MSLPQPYWQSPDGRHVIYCADCLAILPHLTGVDAVVTDPPYGIGRDGKPFSTSSHGGHKGYEFLGWDATRPNEQAFRHIVSATNEAVIWGGNYFADLLPPCRGWLVWDKGQRIDQADAELAWTSLNIPVRVQTLNRVAIASDGAVHPTQKPVALMVWCIGFVDGETILDPFMGSGTTGVACIRTGRRFIGVEISETYCKIAAQRMERELSQPFLPTLQPAANAETPLLPSM